MQRCNGVRSRRVRATTLPNVFPDRAQVVAWLCGQLPVDQRDRADEALRQLEREGYLELVPSRCGLLVRVLVQMKRSQAL